jgi:ATP-binding cassette, subfamily B, bacterial
MTGGCPPRAPEPHPTAGVAPGDRWLRRLGGYCWRHPRLVLLALGGSAAATGMQAAIPLIMAWIVDSAIVTRREPVWLGASVLIAAGLVNFAAVYTRRYRGSQLALEVQHDLRTELFGSLSQLDGECQDRLHTGQLASRSISDLTMVFNLLSIVPMLTGNVLLFAASIVIMAVLSPLLTLVALAVAPALWLIAVASRRKLFPASWDAQQKEGEVAGVVESAVTGVRVVKGFGQEEQETGRLEAAAARLYSARVRVVRLSARYTPALGAIPMLGQAGVLALGGWLALHGSIRIGVFLAFSLYVGQLVAPVRVLSGLITVGQEARASVIRVFEVVDSKPVITERPGAVSLPAGAPAVEFGDVRFGYLPSEPVLRGLSLRVRPGETLALVGTSGSGKSTISLLLPRFYDVSAGAIRIGGHDVRDLALGSLRASIGLVMEDSFLFSGTIRDNISYGRPDATCEQVQAAARAAEADEFIAALPGGYDTVIGEQGFTLSGGQRQRIALARALITDPALLVLDDATSAIDSRVEAQIHATLRKVMAGRTTLLIAHRRSTVALADRIAVLDAGQVVDEGTHGELVQRCPLYRLLLSGPGEDAEGVDAGELASYAGDPGQRLWPDRPSVQPQAGTGYRLPAASGGLAGVAAGGGGAARGGRGRGALGGGGMLAGVPATPELLAKVAALPPATELPRIDRAAARAPEPRLTLRRLLRPIALALIVALVLDGLDAVAGIVMPVLVRSGVDNGILARRFHAIATVSLIAVAIVAADWLVGVAQTNVIGRNGERMLYALRVKIFSQLQRLGLDFYEREMSGRIMTRMTTDVDALDTFLQSGLITMVNALLTFAGVLIALLVINVRLGITLLAVLPVMLAATAVFRVRSSRAYAQARERVGAVNADLQENVAGLRTAQAYRREGRNLENFAGLSDSYRRSRLRAQRYISLYFPFLQLLATVAGALVLFVAAGEVHSGALTAGGLIAYLLYIDLLFSPVQQLSQVFDGYNQAAVGLNRIRELLRQPVSTPQAQRPRPVGHLHGEVEFRDVHFRYPGQPQEALAGVSLRVRPGETVALVGQTGAGKSTMVKLVARYYDVTSGSLLVDGVDVRELDLTGYRHRLGVVPQEPHLSPGTVRDAIAYGRPGATDAEVEAAARETGAIDMIARLPGGFGHPVAERGRNLSAGQRQLIALTRAYLVDPAILLLDEATAALDQATEMAVNRSTARLAARRTTLIIAHRLSTAAQADRIAVLEAGRITEAGTHAELLRRGGSYAALWAAFTGDPELVA